MAKHLALIVDDEPDIRELVIMTLERMELKCLGAQDVAEAKKMLAENDFSLCLTDMRLPDGDGIELVEFMQKKYPTIPVAVITAYGNMELAVTALKAGAFDFVSKPVNLQILRDLINSALLLSSKIVPVPHVQLIGKTKVMQQLRDTIAKLSRSQAPILITGASGTGKELVARLIHEQGPRTEQAFVPVNCGAIPEELMESEFFGYKKGSFTGATHDKAGLFQAANGGTLFLDEVAELPIAMQVKLLRAIQEKAVRQIGGDQETPINVRILSATHKDLQELVNTGEFRQDLYYRINVIKLDVPALTERKGDIILLAEHFIQQISQQLDIEPPTLTEESKQALIKYPFPGNIRELENILERAITLTDNSEINLADLQLPQKDQKHDSKNSAEQNTNLESYLGDVEKDVIVKALEKHQWNRTAAAKELGISLRALRYRLKKLGI